MRIRLAGAEPVPLHVRMARDGEVVPGIEVFLEAGRVQVSGREP